MPFGSGRVAVQELTGGTGFGGAQGKFMPVMVGGLSVRLVKSGWKHLMGMYTCSFDGLCFLSEIRRNVLGENEVALNYGCLGWRPDGLLRFVVMSYGTGPVGNHGKCSK